MASKVASVARWRAFAFGAKQVQLATSPFVDGRKYSHQFIAFAVRSLTSAVMSSGSAAIPTKASTLD